MKNKTFGLAVAALLGVQATPSIAATLTLSFSDNLSPGAAALPLTKAANTPFDRSTEFRFVDADGTVPPSGSNTKDVFNGSESWTFGGANIVGAELTGVGGTPGNVGGSTRAPITNSASGFPICSGANTTGCPTIQQVTTFAGSSLEFNFLAPVAGSEPGNAFGPATILEWNPALSDGFKIHFPVLQFQWGDGNYVLGADYDPGTPGTVFNKSLSPGITFVGGLDNGVANTFRLYAEHTITNDEPAITSFNLQTVQWEVVGTYGTSTVPIPATAWLFASGLLGLVSIARRKKA